MKKTLLIALIVVGAVSVWGQDLTNISVFNRANMDFNLPDSLLPFSNPSSAPANIGTRSVWVADDLDQDGKPEVIAVDYSNRGRVHVMEMNGDQLEIVWSSPLSEQGGGSTPRWVRSGDLDGDGRGEIIFPNSLNSSVDIRVRVFEWDGSGDNAYIEAIDLLADAFAAQGVGNFRTNREVAEVYDFDGDGLDELIMANRDNRVYVLGISGDIPGFGGWQLEGGDPAVVPKIGAGSWWHSVAADINGDGDIEIVNHYWNFYGFYSIDPTGPDTYMYPDTALANEYFEFLVDDAVAYMGVQPVDVDGDGKDEIAGIAYGSSYDITLVSIPNGGDELYSWDSTNFAVIGTNLWEQGGAEAGSFWGIGAGDINGNGREDILLGGVAGYDVMALEYNGTGNLLDMNNYSARVAFDGNWIHRSSHLEIRDSAGTIDTVSGLLNESPFVSKMSQFVDINGNGHPEIVISYQSTVDSLKRTYTHWQDTTFVTDSVVTFWNPDQVIVRVLEATATGLRELDFPIVSPDQYTLEQNYPNPFNPTTSIRFTLPLDKNISLKVYDILGNEVKTLVANEKMAKGSYEVTWDGTNNSGIKVASGQYIYSLKYGNFSKSMKMTLLK
jgi:hypothetical protein